MIAPGTTCRRSIFCRVKSPFEASASADVPAGMSRAATSTVTSSSFFWTLCL